MENFPSKSEMEKLLKDEMDRMDAGPKEYLQEKLILLKTKTLKWEYGDEEEFPAWVFADLEEQDVGVAYCRGGHGGYGDVWGLIFFHDDLYWSSPTGHFL
ncbi:hypothetical protein [Pleionea litopenaei]|uniref:Uncharacterized protein n=1 Tax=Pleionea litopenaei TaxID=3070815 RepID=A0AA51X9C0_9GAMM|nr:hypothetical protein [Pleionea sp. HL-JVS1]WMS89020.1 hypothetical protein Q9312_08915 [Pleionea sp. HL-JVS1]